MSTHEQAHTGHGPRAHRIVDDRDTYTVALDLTPIAVSILNDLLIGLKARSGSIASLIAAANASGSARRDLLHRVIEQAGLTEPFQVLLHPDVADELRHDLAEACETPARCDCGNYLLDEEHPGSHCAECKAMPYTRIGA